MYVEIKHTILGTMSFETEEGHQYKSRWGAPEDNRVDRDGRYNHRPSARERCSWGRFQWECGFPESTRPLRGTNGPHGRYDGAAVLPGSPFALVPLQIRPCGP